MKIEVLDTTLRDGAQGFGISFTENDKLKIIRTLDDLGVDFIEAGNFALDEDMRLLENSASYALSSAKLVAFGATRHPRTAVSEDARLLRAAALPVSHISLFGKARLFHVTEVLRTTPEENLEMIRDSVSFFVSHGKEVIFDAEQFFDGYSENAPYALEVLKTACRAGARAVVLCDTNGGMLPDVVGMVTERVVRTLPGVTVGIHCHNDLGMAVACTVQGVLAGASQVHVTVSGIGERCGNANLSTVVPLLQLKLGYRVIPSEKLKRLTSAARYINEIANRSFDESEPFVGGSAFTHKAGMHVDAVNKAPASFEHIEPELVGNRRNTLISSLSGKGAIWAKMREFMPGVTKDAPAVSRAVERIKELEAAGYRFEDAEASLYLRLREAAEEWGKERAGHAPDASKGGRNALCAEECGQGSERGSTGGDRPVGRYDGKYFELKTFRVMISESQAETQPLCAALIKIAVGESEEITAAEGEGPVNALDLALRKALTRFYPRIADIRLCDYQVRVLDSGSDTASKVLVRVSTTDNRSVWRTVGVSPDIIDASWQALSDSMIYFLEKQSGQ